MIILYPLKHVRPVPDTENEQYTIDIGIYSSRENAEKAIERYKDKPGFCRFPNGFRIGTRVLDREGCDEYP